MDVAVSPASLDLPLLPTEVVARLIAQLPLQVCA